MSSSGIVKSDKAAHTVLEYNPPKFELGTPEQAMAYVEAKREKKTKFRMSDAVRLQTGVNQVEEVALEEQVDRQVLERLKSVQENAYKEAYELGLAEGKKEALQTAKTSIDERLEKFDVMLKSIANLKKELIQQNESHLVQLAMHMASRLAHVEVKSDPSVIVNVIKEAIEMAQIEENVTVQVSPLQIEFLESLKKETGREFEFVKKIKLEPVDTISEGGCIIQTNYGEIDARFEERVNKLWSAVSESLYRVKDKVSAA